MITILGLLLFLSRCVFSDHIFYTKKRIDEPHQSTSSAQKQENETGIKMRRHDNNDEVKAILEEKYRVRNDEATTRFKIAIKNKKDLSDDKKTWLSRASTKVRIFGGMATNISSYPYTVSISRHGRHVCGGAIIDEQWVLSAAHCFRSKRNNGTLNLTAIRIRAGSSYHFQGGVVAELDEAFFPLEYVPGYVEYDFTLLRLDRPLPLGQNIAVVDLPSTDYVIIPGEMLTVTGWGSTNETGSAWYMSDHLRFVTVPAMGFTECLSAYGPYTTPRLFCAGYKTGGKDACSNDSGGPAVHDGVLLGIVAYGGKLCGDPNAPGVYSRVSEITWWVEETIDNNEASSVPRLQENIKRARMREKNSQRFKANAEYKKNQINKLLQETLKSPSLIELTKKMISEAQAMRRGLLSGLSISEYEDFADYSLEDDLKLSNLIKDRILQGVDENEEENMLSSLALGNIIVNESKDERLKDGFEELLAILSRDDLGRDGNTMNYLSTLGGTV